MKTIASLEGVDIIQKNYQQVIIRGDGKEEFKECSSEIQGVVNTISAYFI